MVNATKLLAGVTMGALITTAVIRRWTSADLSGQVALITGSSRGLGLLIAHELAHRGCRLVICARSADELRVAEDDLATRGAAVLAVPCDITERDQVEQLVERSVARYGRLDILVNNAGIIQVGPVSEMAVEDFLSAVKIMQLGPIYLTLAALPHLLAAPSGRVVNITSIGGKVAVPHLLPYVSAKFGAVGFSEGLHAELARYGVNVTTVVPGLMRTGSHLRALFTGQPEKEYTWFAAGARAPLVTMDAHRAARRIVNAAAAGRAELTLTPLAVAAARVAGLAPGTTARLLGMVGRLLPGEPGKPSPARPEEAAAAGSPSRARAALASLGRRAAERFQPAVGSRA